jgi:crooked neck
MLSSESDSRLTLVTLTVWLQYAVFEEIDTEDYDRVRDIYKAAIKLVPHKQFTFAKVR